MIIINDIIRQCMKEVKGTVSIEYRDPISERIREKFTGENYAFPAPWRSINGQSFLGQSTVPSFFLTDSDVPVNPKLPYLPGRIIGWSGYGLNMSGVYQGQEVEAERRLYMVDDEHKKYFYEFVFDFYPTQVIEPVKAMGFTSQYAPAMVYTTNHYGTPRFRYDYLTTETQPWISNGKLSYRIPTSTSPVVQIIDPICRKNMGNIDLTSLLVGNVSGGTYHLGINFLTGQVYVYCYHATAANRQIWEFSDLTFTTVTRTWTALTNFTANVASRLFWVDNLMNFYYWNSNLYIGNIEENINPAVDSSFMGAASPYLTIGNATGSLHNLIAKEGKLFLISEHYTNAASSYIRHPIIDLETMSYYGEMAAQHKNGSGSYAGQVALEPCPGEPILIGDRTLAHFKYRQAFTHYRIPDDAPSRPANTIMRIRYRVDWILPQETD